MGDTVYCKEDDKHFGRREFMQRAQISDSEFRQLSAQGVIKARFKNSHGWVLYTNEDVSAARSYLKARYIQQSVPPAPLAKIGRPLKDAALRPRLSRDQIEKVGYTKEEARIVWPLLSAGKTCEEIFIQTDIHPLVLERLMMDHVRLNNRLSLSCDQLAAIHALSINGVVMPFKDGKAVVTAFQAIEARDNTVCVKCKTTAPARVCVGCMRQRVTKELQAAAAIVQKPPTEVAAESGTTVDERRRQGNENESAA